MELTAQTPSLRVFRALDADRLSDEFKEKFLAEEGAYDYVDGDKARDHAWTEEIMETTIGAVLVDAEGNVLHEFEGPTALRKAEAARSSARITFSIGFDEDVMADADDMDDMAAGHFA